MATIDGEPAPLVFLHVMKCGGTAIRHALDGAVGDGAAIFRLDGTAAMTAVGGIVHQAENWRFRADLLAYLLAGPRPELIYGHFRYSNVHRDLLSSARLVTLLRPPEDRVVSLHRYRQFSGRADGLAAAPSLTATLEDPAYRAAGHHYVETFCGDPALPPRSDEAIAAAIENLRRFDVVGRMSDMNGFASAVGSLLAGSVEIRRLNESPAPADHDDDADALAEQLRAACAPDRAVFEAVCPA